MPFVELDIMSPPNAEGPATLPTRLAARVKQKLIAGKEGAVSASWRTLLHHIGREVELIARDGSEVIPAIDFSEITSDFQSAEFSNALRRRGIGIVRGVISKEVIREWENETDKYMRYNASIEPTTTPSCQPADIYWSPTQVRGRAYPNILATQRFLMHLWHASDPDTPVATNFPTTYANQLYGSSQEDWNTDADDGSEDDDIEKSDCSIYGRRSPYREIWEENWVNYDPWDHSKRFNIAGRFLKDDSRCSMFRMFQGLLYLDGYTPGDDLFQICPMIQLSTAYTILRPFFSPINTSPSHPDFLAPDNWTLTSSSPPTIHRSMSFAQEVDSILNPHLQESMVPIPQLGPGDYLVWHPDSIFTRSTVSAQLQSESSAIYIPACPLTQMNAQYLARQRRAFLLGHPSPDSSTRDHGGQSEAHYMGRPGVQEVSDAGSDDGLRAMGLLAWDDDDAETEIEAEVLEMANNILFPDRYDFA